MDSISDFEDFITSKGGPELLLATQSNEEFTHTELTNRLEVNPRTISDRIDDALKLGLISRNLMVDGNKHKNFEPYELTPDGIRLKRALESVDYLSKKKEVIEAQRELEETIESVFEWEVKFQDKARKDSSKDNRKTLQEFGFPGDHSYSDPLAFLEKNDDWDGGEQDFFLAEPPEDDEYRE